MELNMQPFNGKKNLWIGFYLYSTEPSSLLKAPPPGLHTSVSSTEQRYCPSEVNQGSRGKKLEDSFIFKNDSTSQVQPSLLLEK